jgi:hypothetical protein
MIINPYTNTDYDDDAVAYFAKLASVGAPANGIERAALSKVFKRMKGTDLTFLATAGDSHLWDKRIAFYPGIAQSLTAYRYNAFYPTETTGQDGPGWPNAPGYATIGSGVSVDGIFGPKGDGTSNTWINTNLNARTGTASQLSGTNACVGAVYKNTRTTGRDDFGTYNTGTNYDANLWLRTLPTPNARIYCYEGTLTGGTNGDKGHWMILANSTGRSVWNRGTQLSYTPGTIVVNEPDGFFGSMTFLALNYNNMNNYGYNSFVNNSENTLLTGYILGGIADAYVTAWNQIIEDFMIDTGKKTW